jgi:hypothetical protein
MPATPFSWTNESALGTNIPKGQNLVITWSGGDANSTVIVNGYSTNPQSSAGSAFICAAGAGAGQIVVPTTLLSVISGTQGELIVINRSAGGSLQATGVDAGLGNITAETEFDKAVSYGNPALPGSCNNPNLATTNVNLAGTATALAGTFPLACINGVNGGSAHTGSAQVPLTGTTANGQTTYKGNVTGNGTMTCPDGSPGNWSVNFPLTLNVTPAVGSLTANGGLLSGNFNLNGPPRPYSAPALSPSSMVSHWASRSGEASSREGMWVSRWVARAAVQSF